MGMMQNLGLDEGGLVQVESATLPVATFSKFQPLTTDFLNLTNPKAVLEMRLRHFACLSKGDIIAINYNKKIYELKVLEPQPMEEEPELDISSMLPEPTGFIPFSGTG